MEMIAELGASTLLHALNHVVSIFVELPDVILRRPPIHIREERLDKLLTFSFEEVHSFLVRSHFFDKLEHVHGFLESSIQPFLHFLHRTIRILFLYADR